MDNLITCLWFDTEGEDAAKFYASIFPSSKVGEIARYGSSGPRPEGTVMTVSFELMGQQFVALNGGPEFKFNEAISFQILCDDQAEIDRYSDQLTADGGEEGPCGWVKDKFGVSWQVVPKALMRLLRDSDAEKAQRVMAAMLQMKKIDVAELERAAAA
jgi:predicted 3-demethylubiquinone-9 3-methyltransferase (glyoxalase superfamily)